MPEPQAHDDQKRYHASKERHQREQGARWSTNVIDHAYDQRYKRGDEDEAIIMRSVFCGLTEQTFSCAADS
jgi:hypothetical protein